MALPIVSLAGEPYEQGCQHGRALRNQIARNLAVYYDRFAREAHLGADEVRRRASCFLPMVEGHPYFEVIRGIATASGYDLRDLLMLNMRYELLYYQYSILPVGSPDGCTSFGLLPDATANGHMLIGENWDWIPDVAGAVLHTREPDGLETLAFTEAGIVGGKLGLNSAGLGLVINGLLSTADDWSRGTTPFHVRCYDILRQTSLESAARIVTDEARACSANFLIAQTPDQIVDIEAAPNALCQLLPSDGTVAHTNHFLDPNDIGIQEPEFSERRPHSRTRLARIGELLGARRPLSIGDLQACLRDHDNYPDSVCRHVHPDDPPEEACTTVTSAIIDLDERSVWLTDGPPCEGRYERHAL